MEFDALLSEKSAPEGDHPLSFLSVYSFFFTLHLVALSPRTPFQKRQILAWEYPSELGASFLAYGKDYFLEQPYVPVVTEIILFYEK